MIDSFFLSPSSPTHVTLIHSTWPWCWAMNCPLAWLGPLGLAPSGLDPLDRTPRIGSSRLGPPRLGLLRLGTKSPVPLYSSAHLVLERTDPRPLQPSSTLVFGRSGRRPGIWHFGAQLLRCRLLGCSVAPRFGRSGARLLRRWTSLAVAQGAPPLKHSVVGTRLLPLRR